MTQPWYMNHSPEIGKSFAQFYKDCKDKGTLDKKTKELLMLALACAFRCPHCTEEHVKGALEAGATKEEVTETLMITALEGAGTQLMWKKEVFDNYLGHTP